MGEWPGACLLQNSQHPQPKCPQTWQSAKVSSLGKWDNLKGDPSVLGAGNPQHNSQRLSGHLEAQSTSRPLPFGPGW